MNEGFFTVDESSSVVAEKRERAVFKKPRCSKCRLCDDCDSPVMKPYGKSRNGIMILGEAPGTEEDRQGKPFVGPSGRFLAKKLRDIDVYIDDCVRLNAINCYKSEKPTASEVDYCRPIVWNAIKKHKPDLILALGGSAVDSLLGHRWGKDSVGGITKWRGWQIPDRDLKTFVCPIFHPAYILRNTSKGPHVSETIFENDLANAIALPPFDEREFQFEPEAECIETLTDPAKIVAWLRENVKEGSMVAFDYETTGRKPEAVGHRVVSCGVAVADNKAIGFPTDTTSVRKQWTKILANPGIFKIAHNLQFEERWSRWDFEQAVEGWIWDTQLTAHILDNRREVYGLKFQAYVRFGIPDYDSDIAPFLKGTEERDGNAFNRVTSAPTDKLLYYNAMDALLTFRLCTVQDYEISSD